jgi:predicted alpha/beta-fold hydrolase
MPKSPWRAALVAALSLPLSAAPLTTARAFATPAAAPARQASTPLPAGFTSATVQVNGTALHYVRGGKGPVVVLVHGFPEDWSEYRAIMPRLARRFTVVALDLRGIGGSTPASGGYDAANRAKDIHDLAAALKLDRLYLVGHDLGGITAYAYGAGFASALIAHRLVDEYQFYANPAVLSEGLSIFQGHGAGSGLKLLEGESYDSGIVVTRYAPANADGQG